MRPRSLRSAEFSETVLFSTYRSRTYSERRFLDGFLVFIGHFFKESTAVSEMSRLYSLALDASSALLSSRSNNTHSPPQCFDSKQGNITKGVLTNYDAKDGGIPINFGLNCLGWMVCLIISMLPCIKDSFFVAVCILVNLHWSDSSVFMTI